MRVVGVQISEPIAQNVELKSRILDISKVSRDTSLTVQVGVVESIRSSTKHDKHINLIYSTTKKTVNRRSLPLKALI